MNRFYMNRFNRFLPVAFSVLAFCALTQTTNAQITYTESFDATQFPPTGWTRIYNGGGFAQPWGRQTNGTNPTTLPHSGAGMARFNSNSLNFPDGTTADLVTPAINWSQVGSDTATVSFWLFRDSSDAGPDSLTVWVNTAPTDSGGTRIGAVARYTGLDLPDTVPASSWYQYTFNVPNTFNTDTNYVIFQGTSHQGNSIFIDDVSWVAFPILCSGTPTAGSIAASSLFICGGSGTSDLTLNGSTAFAGIAYQWQSADSLNGAWTDVGTSDSLYTTDVLTASAYFRTVVTCTNSGLSDTSDAVQVVVSTTPLPSVAVSPTTIGYCLGSPAVPLQATGANTYTWTPATGLDVTTGNTVLASPVAGGGFGGNVTYTVTGVDSLGCVNTATATVQVHQNPTVNSVTASSDTVCNGGSVTLTAQTTGGGGGGGGLTYLWIPEGLSGNNAVAHPTGNTTYTVTVSNTNGCTDTGSVAITVYQASTANFNYSVSGMTVSFTDNSVNAANYVWDFGDGNISLQHNPVYTYSAPGTYTVVLTAGSGTGCAGDTQAVTITVFPLGIEGLNGESAINVSPNPTEDFVNVSFRTTEATASIELINAIGQVMIGETISSNGGRFSKSLQLGQLPSGVYTVRVKSGSDYAIRKIVKQ